MIETYVKQFERARPGTAPKWLAELQRESFEAFRRRGFPSPKEEEWRFTPLASLERVDFAPIAISSTGVDLSLTPYLFGHAEWPRIVFVDGAFSKELSSLPSLAGVSIESLREVLSTDGEWLARYVGNVAKNATTFVALNTAFVADGAVIRINAGHDAGLPIHVLHVVTKRSENARLHPRLLVVVGRGARAQIVESFVSVSGKDRYWTNGVAEIVLEEDAWLEHCRLQRESEQAYHIAFSQVTQARGSHYRSFSLAMGGQISRHDFQVRVGGSGAETLLYGLYFGHGDQLVDNHTTIFHDEPGCRSWEVYKGILDDRAHGVFNGKIRVDSIAQQTDAKQTNRALLLSEHAKIDTKPQLEIFADDVKCTHGATVGYLDQLAAFYLRSRGIDAGLARRILTYAFAAEVLDQIATVPVRQVVDFLVRERVGVGG